MFVLVFTSNDTGRTDIKPGTPFLVLGGFADKSHCQRWVHSKNSYGADLRQIGSDRDGIATSWLGETYFQSRKIMARVDVLPLNLTPQT